MKRYIRATHLTTEVYDKDLGERFVAYCNNANKNRKNPTEVEILGVGDGFNFKFISGLKESELYRLVNQFKNKLASEGTPIIFELSNEENHHNKIIRLQFDMTPKK